MGKQVQPSDIVVAPSLLEKNIYFLFRKNGREIKIEIVGKGLVNSTEPLSNKEMVFFIKKRFRK